MDLARLKKARKDRGLSQNKLARLADLSRLQYMQGHLGDGEKEQAPSALTPEQSLAAYERNRCIAGLIASDGCAKVMPAGIYTDELKAACCNGDCTKN